MLRNDTWCGRDAHQGLTEGFGPWRVGWSGPGRIGGTAGRFGRRNRNGGGSRISPNLRTSEVEGRGEIMDLFSSINTLWA